jgi:general secretion pathway protein G
MSCVSKNVQKTTLLKSARGFSLIEILIALTLLGIAGTFVVGQIFDRLHEGQVRSAKIQMSNLANQLQEYRRRCNYYPTTEQGLQALISAPSGGRQCRNYPPNGFLETPTVPLDPWDNEFVYVSDGRTFNIISLGPDGEEGGEGRDADIYLYDQGGADQGDF